MRAVSGVLTRRAYSASRECAAGRPSEGRYTTSRRAVRMRTQTYGSLIAVLVLALSGSARAATTYGPVSVAGDGSIGNATSGGGDYWPISVSADGNEVAF